ncbi:MAG: GNAT family N-acetyltransferase [Pyrinomonadaceae bacterium]
MDAELRRHFRIDDQTTMRAFCKEDAEAIYACVIRNRDHLSPFMHWMTPDYSFESARRFVDEGRRAVAERAGLSLGIFRAGEFVGSAALVYIDHISRKTEIGYWIDRMYEGRGLVSAACCVLIEYAFGELEMNRVEIRCATENVRSSAIPERLGFTLEGVLRQVEMRGGRLHDFAIYGLLADEWHSRRNRIL